MKKTFFSVLFTFLFFLFICFPAFADQNFSNSFDITYTVSENGQTHAVFNGSLENETDKFYASSYSLQVGFDEINNIQASDNDGVIRPTIQEVEGGKTISLPFNHKAVGLHSATNFTLSFDTPNIATHVGSIWEINIPGIANQTDFKTFTVHLRVPPSFGQPAYIKPAQAGNSLDFDKNALGSSGISIAFGNLQAYDFTLNYHLKNDNLFPVNTEIALPLTTNYQDVVINDISPKPTNVKMDPDGNWLAQYTLLPSQKVQVVAKGTAYVSLTPKQETLTAAQRAVYLQDQPYWQANDPAIKKLAQDLKTPDAIFQYVVGHLHYDFSRVAGKQERLGAIDVLNNPDSAVCLEFTDLFVALARAAGIPAREVDGFAYTENTKQRPLSLVQDILHAWPEYYDDGQGAWIMVDPTWENTTKGTDYFTKLDFDHVAFVIKGAKSGYPVPAGGYKLPGNENTKDVFVSFNLTDTKPSPKFSLLFDISPTLLSGVPITGNVIIRNASGVLIPSEEVTVTTASLSPHAQKVITPQTPPFGMAQIPIRFKAPSILTNSKETITIQVAGNTITKEISVYPFFFQESFIIGGITFVILCFIILIIATKPWRLFTSQ